MKKVFSSDMRKNLKSCLDMAAEEPLIVERRNAENLVMLSEEMYNNMVNKKPENLEILIEQRVDANLEKRLTMYADFINKMRSKGE